ncbi:MAG: PAS domain-containing protein [Verrucomicrobiales bacterium]
MKETDDQQSGTSPSADAETLLRTGRHFRTLVDNISHLAWMADEHGELFWYNQRWHDYTGKQPDEMRGLGWAAVHHPDHAERIIERLKHSRDSADSWEDTVPLKGKDGKYRWFLARAVPVRDESGRLTCWLGTNTDITEQREVEQALRESQDRLELALTSAEMGAWEANLETGESFWDERAAALLGMLPEEAPTTIPEWLAFVDPEDRQRIETILQGILEGSVTRVDTDFRWDFPDGGQRWLANIGVMKRGDDGARKIHGVVMDISRRKGAEEKQRESEERLRLAQLTAGVGTFHYNIQTGAVHWSPEIEALYGLSPGKFEGTFEAWKSCVHPDDFPEAERRVRKAMETGDFEDEWRAVWPDGTERWVSARGKVFMDGAGRPLRMVGANVDITDRKRAEEELRRSNEELEGRVARRTAELELRAEQLSRLTSELTLTEQRERRRLSHTIHDHLQQLLVGAKFGMQTLDKQLADTEREAFEQVGWLLDESIKVSRSLTVELASPILYEAGLAAGLEWLGRWMEEKHGLSVEVRVDGGADIPREDIKTLVFQSVRELLLNVVKHAGVDEASVEMKFEDSESVRVTVADGGRGFDPEMVRHGAPDLSGGFGLFSIRERMTLLGGYFEFESVEGGGARFTLVAPVDGVPRDATAPLLPMAAQARPEEIPADPSPAARKRNDGRVRLLLVDDHEMICQGLSMLLAVHEDMEIVGQAGDGLEALDRARKLKPDVVLMDFSMPKMDGVEATRRLHEEMPEVRVIGLSMYEESDRAAAMMNAGASEYLTKGGNTDILLDAIRRVNAAGAA